MSDLRTQLVEKVTMFYEGKKNIAQFWKDFHLFYADIPDADPSFAEKDWAFFEELNERLHYTDFQSPPDENLESSETFKNWVDINFPKYLNGSWKYEGN